MHLFSDTNDGDTRVRVSADAKTLPNRLPARPESARHALADNGHALRVLPLRAVKSATAQNARADRRKVVRRRGLQDVASELFGGINSLHEHRPLIVSPERNGH